MSSIPALLHLDHPRLQGDPARSAAAGLGLGLGVGHDARLVALGDHGEAVGAHHREEQLQTSLNESWALETTLTWP